jgi:hypothetical protein
MAAGMYPAGAGPAGHPPVAPMSDRTPVRRVAAALFDPVTHDNPTDELGRVIEVHPVDQAVAIALSSERGRLTSTPDIGNRLRGLPRADDPTFANAARDDVARTLATLIGRGDVTLLGVDVSPAARETKSREIIVRYQNNRLPLGAPQPPPVRVK